MRRTHMKQNNPDASPGVARTITIAPMRGPTYAEAYGYILQTPRRLETVLEFFSPDEHDIAVRALGELHTLGAVIRSEDGFYMLPSKRDAS